MASPNSPEDLAWAKANPEPIPLDELAERVRGALAEAGRPDLAAGIKVLPGCGITSPEPDRQRDAETLLKAYRIAGGSRRKCPDCWRAGKMLCECGAAEPPLPRAAAAPDEPASH